MEKDGNKRGQIPTNIDCKKPKQEISISAPSQHNGIAEPFQGKTDPNDCHRLSLQQRIQGKTDPSARHHVQDSLNLSDPNEDSRKANENADFALALHQSELEATEVTIQENYAYNIEQGFQRPIYIGKAWEFVAAIHSLQRKLSEPPGDPNRNYLNFSNLAADDLVFLVERFLEKMAEFRSEGKPIHVDIGYHYTTNAALGCIRTDGLMTKAERQANKIGGRFNGARFGDGIYTACNPFAYHEFAGGDIGLFVLRLKGRTEQFENSINLGAADTVLGRSGTDKVTILRSSSQCVALVQFFSGLISLTDDANEGNLMVRTYHRMLQDVVDAHFNDHKRTEIEDVVPSRLSLCYAWTNWTNAHSAATTSRPSLSNVITYTAPETLACPSRERLMHEIPHSRASSKECIVCFEKFCSEESPVVQLTSCSHEFHLECIQKSLEFSCKCPICRKPFSKLSGHMPSGTMNIDFRSDLTCDGFPPGAIVITYDIESGIQKNYHENPGIPYNGTRRVSYLPDNDDGRRLLKRLEHAFTHGLIFTIGTSFTTGQPNSVIWASIHHKTQLSGGTYGFPDPAFFMDANKELDALQVPAAANL